MKKFTHVGVLVAANSCVSPNYRENVNLRETKNFFITENGIKYHKDGHGVGDWPRYRLIEIRPYHNITKINDDDSDDPDYYDPGDSEYYDSKDW